MLSLRASIPLVGQWIFRPLLTLGRCLLEAVRAIVLEWAICLAGTQDVETVTLEYIAAELNSSEMVIAGLAGRFSQWAAVVTTKLDSAPLFAVFS